MGLILCIACGHQRGMSPIPRKEFICGKCGCRHPRLIRREKLPDMIVGGDREGIEPELAQHQAFAGLKRYAEHRGYKPGWASMKFKELFNRWPNGESREEAAPAGHELLAWIRRQNAAYARRMPRRLSAIVPPAESELMTEEDWNSGLWR
jgi:hypothetical protein